jgi:hypothetical protein
LPAGSGSVLFAGISSPRLLLNMLDKEVDQRADAGDEAAPAREHRVHEAAAR